MRPCPAPLRLTMREVPALCEAVEAAPAEAPSALAVLEQAAPLIKGDQLVGVDMISVIGSDFDTAIDAIKGTSGEKTKLTFFRGPTAFLYGPTAPSAEWYTSTFL